jgi:hypothetical protein
MCRAIDAAYEVGEVKDFRDKAIALETYARQALNVEAERRATTIRIRVERRTGELLAQMKKAKGGAEKGTKRDGPGGKVMQSNGPTALRDLGISKQQSSDWQRLAAVPQKNFEAALADKSKMPSTAAIIRENTPRRPPHQQKSPATVCDVAKTETSPITAAREAERGWLHNEVVGKGRGGSVSTMMQPHQVFSASEQLHLADAGERPGLSRLRRLNLGRMQVDLHWTAGPQSKVALLSKHRRDV